MLKRAWLRITRVEVVRMARGKSGGNAHVAVAECLNLLLEFSGELMSGCKARGFIYT